MSRYHTLLTTFILALALCVDGTMAYAAPETDQESPLRLGGQVGGAWLVSRDQTSWLGYETTGVAGSLVAGYRVYGVLYLDARFGVSMFTNATGTGALYEGGVGPRVQFSIGDSLILGGAIHLSVAQTGPDTRPAFDASIGFGVRVGRGLSIGPELSYGQVFQWDRPLYSTDASIVSLGVNFAFSAISTTEPRPPRLARAPTPPRSPASSHPPTRVTPPEPDPELLRLLDRALPPAQRSETTLVPPILFEFDSTELTPCGEVALFTAREVLADLHAHVEVIGHADSTGEASYNDALAAERANKVYEWLIAHGIEASQLTVQSRGAHEPLTNATSETEKPLNRRVVFRVYAEAP